MKAKIIWTVVMWLLDQLLAAILRKPKGDTHEQLPDDHPDGKPSPAKPKRKPKYQGIPGFDRDTGTWK